MRAISVVPLLTLAAVLLTATTLGAQARPDRRVPPQAVPRGEGDRYGRGGYDDRNDERYRRGSQRMDLAFGTGLNDGYEEGYEDGEKRHRFEPTREGRYRSANRGYDRRYGSKEQWQARYRDGFRRGYEDGFNDARRYNYRTGDRPNGWLSRTPDRPWSWWPF